MWLGHSIEHLMCIGGELEHHKALSSPATKNRAVGVLCSRARGIYRQFIGPGSWLEPGLKGKPLVLVQATNRDQWWWARSKAHWSRFVPPIGTKRSRRTGTNGPRGPAGPQG